MEGRELAAGQDSEEIEKIIVDLLNLLDGAIKWKE